MATANQPSPFLFVYRIAASLKDFHRKLKF